MKFSNYLALGAVFLVLLKLDYSLVTINENFSDILLHSIISIKIYFEVLNSSLVIVCPLFKENELFRIESDYSSRALRLESILRN